MSLSENPFSPMATYDTQTTISSVSSLDPKLSRTHYFDGRLLRASDLTRDQFYLDERLREVGRALGQGIVRGLDVSLSANRKLTVTAGLAISPSGRVLELESPTIELNLTDAALIHEMNPEFRSLQPGLYAVVIRYAEKGTGSAEIYPRDLEAQRGFHFNAYAEGVQFALVRLAINLPTEKLQKISAHEVSVYIRAILVRELLLSNGGQLFSIGEDAVALGLLGVEYGMAQWLDKGLLRRPFRSVQSLNYVQEDLYNHYQELFADVINVRRSSANQDKFLASRYFSILPPVGSLPKMAIDPMNAYQNFFPEAYEVSISPVRADDLPSLVQQSMALPPIDLRTDKDVDIMIAVVLDDLKFSLIARKLEIRGSADIPHMQETILSNFIQRKTEPEVNIWQQLWDSVQDIIYLRRPIRAAETQVSAVVLAKGDYETMPVVSNTVNYDVSLFQRRLRDTEVIGINKETLFNKKLTILNKEIEGLKNGNANVLEEEKELAQKASETLEATVGAFESLNEELDKKSKNLQDSVLQLTTELNLLKGEELKKAKADLDVAKTENEKLLNIQKSLENTIVDLKKKIQLLEESGGGSPDNDLGKLKQEYDSLQQQLFNLQELIPGLWTMGSARLEKPSVLADLRKVTEDNALQSQKNLISEVEQNPEAQAGLVSLLSMMHPQFDDLNWLSLEFIFKNKFQEKAMELLTKKRSSNYLDYMLTLVKELGFPDELREAWQKQQDATPIFRFSPATISRIKTLKITQILPASLEITEADRTAIKEAVSADSSLLKPLSQLKTMVGEKYQSLLWATVPAILEIEKLPEFVEFISMLSEKSLPLGLGVAASNNRFKISVALRNAWAEIDLGV